MMRVVDVGAGLDHLLAELGALGLEVGRDLDPTSYFWPFDSSSKIAAFIVMRSTTPLCWSSSPTRPLDRRPASTPRRSRDRVDVHLEVGADLVHLVDEHDARHVVLVGLAPDRLGLRLDAVAAVEHRDRAVEHAQRALDLDREVDVAGRVDDVDAVADALVRALARLPEAVRRGAT